MLKVRAAKRLEQDRDRKNPVYEKDLVRYDDDMEFAIDKFREMRMELLMKELPEKEKQQIIMILNQMEDVRRVVRKFREFA